MTKNNNRRQMKAFIHISDLHVTAFNKPGGVTNTRINNNYLKTQADSENDYYIKEFCKFVNNRYTDTDFYLIISGDIADSAYKEEYDFATSFIQQIQSELNIDEDRILIVPGNHDVDWDECKQAAKNDPDPNKLAYLQFDAKYGNFKNFYNNFFKGKKTFDVNKQIVDYLSIDREKLLFVGINTNYKINYEGGPGAVECNAFRQELSELCSKTEYKEYQKIAIFHHNIQSDSDVDNSPYGDWEQNDWINFKEELERYDFKLLLFGNEHIRASSRKLDGADGATDMFLSDCGSFAKHSEEKEMTIIPSFKIYTADEYDSTETKTHKKVLKQKIYQLIDKGHKEARPFGRWVELSNKDVKEPDEFLLQETRHNNPFTDDQNNGENVSRITLENGLSQTTDDKDNSSLNESQDKSTYIISLNNAIFQEDMMNIIKTEHLYHPGHFHWGGSSRSHNWIDTISLLNNRNHVRLIQKQIREVALELQKIKEIKYEAIIGVGMEGNIMSTHLLFDDIPYAYLPYTYRYDEFDDFEKCICLDNSAGTYKNVLIVTDVVNKGGMLNSLILDKGKEFFNNVENIDIISLFFTGHVRNDEAKKKMPKQLVEIKAKKVEFYSLIQLEVGECPYGDNDFEDKCIICKKNLCEVYIFYNKNSQDI